MCELDSCEEGTIMVAGNCHTVYTVSNVFIKNTGGASDGAIEVNSLKFLDGTENRSKVILTDNDIVSTDTTHSNVTATGDSWASIAAGGKIDISLGNNTKISKVSFKVNNTTDKIQLLFDKKSQGTTTNTDSTKKTYTYDDGKWTYST
jgi:hypothetical protein